MCQGICIFANNKKAIYAKHTNSHDKAQEELKINRDKWRAYEYLWWEEKLDRVHYDKTAEKILEKIDDKKAFSLAKKLVKDKFSTKEGVYRWLKNVKDEWQSINRVKKTAWKNYFFKQITGYTFKQNQAALKKAKKRANAVVERVKKIRWFDPKPILKKSEIKLTVDVCLGLFGLPKAKLSFNWLKESKDWDAARVAARDAAWDAARDAAWDAAWDAARVAAWDAAWDAAQDAAWDAAWDAARVAARVAAWDAAGEIAADLRIYKKQYREVPFKKLLDLWEMGLYPIGLVEGKFLIYVPYKNKKGERVRII